MSNHVVMAKTFWLSWNFPKWSVGFDQVAEALEHQATSVLNMKHAYRVADEYRDR